MRPCVPQPIRQPDEHVTDKEESLWLQGHHAAWLQILRQALRELGFDQAVLAYPELKLARMAAMIEETRSYLRQVCAQHRDLDWDDNLHLRDVIEKHLVKHIREF